MNGKKRSKILQRWLKFYRKCNSAKVELWTEKNSKIVALIQMKQMNRIKMSVNFIWWQLDLSKQKVISGIKCWNLIKYQIEILFFNWLIDGFHRKQVVGKFSIPKFSTIRSHMFVNMTHAALFWQDEIPAIKVITCKLQMMGVFRATIRCTVHLHLLQTLCDPLAQLHATSL